MLASYFLSQFLLLDVTLGGTDFADNFADNFAEQFLLMLMGGLSDCVKHLEIQGARSQGPSLHQIIFLFDYSFINSLSGETDIPC